MLHREFMRTNTFPSFIRILCKASSSQNVTNTNHWNESVGTRITCFEYETFVIHLVMQNNIWNLIIVVYMLVYVILFTTSYYEKAFLTSQMWIWSSNLLKTYEQHIPFYITCQLFKLIFLHCHFSIIYS